MGFFGFTTQAKGPAQPRWRGVVDIDEAYREVGDVLAVWREASAWPDSQPFTGGVWDAWPRRLARGLAFLRAEAKALQAYLMEVDRG